MMAMITITDRRSALPLSSGIAPLSPASLQDPDESLQDPAGCDGQVGEFSIGRATNKLARPPLRTLVIGHRRGMVFAYALSGLENTLRIVQPFVLGWAINDLIVRSYHGLIVFVVQHLAFMLVGAARQMSGPRVFGRLFVDAMSKALADGSSAVGQPLPDDESSAALRLTKVRESVELLESGVPLAVQVLFSTVGVLLFLGWYDITLVPLCLVLLVPAVLLNAAYGRKRSLFSGRVRAEQERTAGLLVAAEPRNVHRQFEALQRWRIELSDSQATRFCLMELFVLGVLATILVHFCLTISPRAGDLVAVLQYVLIFVAGLGAAPQVARRFSQWR